MEDIDENRTYVYTEAFPTQIQFVKQEVDQFVESQHLRTMTVIGEDIHYRMPMAGTDTCSTNTYDNGFHTEIQLVKQEMGQCNQEPEMFQPLLEHQWIDSQPTYAQEISVTDLKMEIKDELNTQVFVTEASNSEQMDFLQYIPALNIMETTAAENQLDDVSEKISCTQMNGQPSVEQVPMSGVGEELCLKNSGLNIEIKVNVQMHDGKKKYTFSCQNATFLSEDGSKVSTDVLNNAEVELAANMINNTEGELATNMINNTNELKTNVINCIKDELTNNMINFSEHELGTSLVKHSEDELKTNMLKNTGEIVFRPTCEYCQESFSHVNKLKEHMCYNHAFEYKPYLCEICREEFTEIEGLEHHKQIMHSVEYTDPTHEYCQKKDPRQEQFVSHMRIHYKRVICDICRTTFTDMDSFNHHMQMSHGHPIEREYVCNYCLKRFDRKRQLVGHMQIHSAEIAYVPKDTLRGDVPTDSDELIMGNSVVTPTCNRRSYLCDVCGSTFRLKIDLILHMRTHFSYICDICHRKYGRKCDLVRHSNTAHNQRCLSE